MYLAIPLTLLLKHFVQMPYPKTISMIRAYNWPRITYQKAIQIVY